jgi:hypothetical protein
MNASTVVQTGQAMTHPPPPVQHLLLTEIVQVKATHTANNLDADTITHRATAITVVLKDILKQPGYRHGGLNE